MQCVKAKGSTISHDSSIVGACHINSVLNALTCDIEFENGGVS